MPWAGVHVMPIREQIRRPIVTTNRGLHFLKTADICIKIAGIHNRISARALVGPLLTALKVVQSIVAPIQI